MAPAITHVIFNMNGALIDMDVVANLLADWAKNNGKYMNVDIKSYIREMDSLKEIIFKFFESINLINDRVRHESLKELLRMILYKGLKLSAGTDRLVKHLFYNNIPMAIVSGGSRREFDLICQRFGTYIDRFFKHVVCAPDDPEVIFNKPKPDLYITCANRFPRPPESMGNVLILEDSLSGATGASDSGSQTVFIYDNLKQLYESFSGKIVLHVNNLDDFRPESVGLPPYGSLTTRL